MEFKDCYRSGPELNDVIYGFIEVLIANRIKDL